MATSGSVRRTLFRCKGPIRCQRIGKSARAAAFSQSCCGRLSPSSTHPAATNGRTTSADTYFVTATNVTSLAERPARAAAAAIRPRTRATFSAIRAANRHLIDSSSS